MAQIKCPNCGTERVVVEGKKKRCRKCGTTLTTLPPKPAPEVTAASLAEQYPEQIEELLRTAAAKAVSDEEREERREILKENFGELTSELLIAEYPEIVEQLTAAAKRQAATETTEKISGEIAETLRKKIDKMKPDEFAEQFPTVYKKIVRVGKKELKAKRKDKGQKPEDEELQTPNTE